MYNLWLNHTCVRPRNKRKKLHRYRYYYSLFCKSIEQFITDYLDKLARRAENSLLLHPLWIYSIRPKIFDLTAFFLLIFEPPDTAFCKIT